jgi:hypothetical protein
MWAYNVNTSSTTIVTGNPEAYSRYQKEMQQDEPTKTAGVMTAGERNYA